MHAYMFNLKALCAQRGSPFTKFLHCTKLSQILSIHLSSTLQAAIKIKQKKKNQIKPKRKMMFIKIENE